MILLDLDMPIMSGYEACQMIRSISNNDAACAIKGLFKIV
jgi:CheY-like chemotaxis protein